MATSARATVASVLAELRANHAAITRLVDGLDRRMTDQDKRINIQAENLAKLTELPDQVRELSGRINALGEKVSGLAEKLGDVKSSAAPDLAFARDLRSGAVSLLTAVAVSITALGLNRCTMPELPTAPAPTPIIMTVEPEATPTPQPTSTESPQEVTWPPEPTETPTPTPAPTATPSPTPTPEDSIVTPTPIGSSIGEPGATPVGGARLVVRGQFRVISASVNVRSGPSTGYPVLYTMQQGVTGDVWETWEAGSDLWLCVTPATSVARCGQWVASIYRGATNVAYNEFGGGGEEAPPLPSERDR